MPTCFSITEDFALFEDNLSPTPQLRLLWDLKQEIRVDRPDQIDAALTAIEAASHAGHWVALAAHYELGLALEPRLSSRLAAHTPLLRAWVYQAAQTLTSDAITPWWHGTLAQLSPQQREAGILSLTPSRNAAQHSQDVAHIQAMIAAGDCYQVNLTYPLHGQAYGHPLALYARLREAQPVRYGAFIRHREGWIVSRSPELFVARTGDRLDCRPMKGTAARLPDAAQDAAQAQALQASAKNRAENLMIVDLIRNDLGRLVSPGGVRTRQLFELESYRTVYQLTSSITAEPVRADLKQIIGALFPCGSITGAPKIRAMELIDDIEQSPRGLYCGALGWLAPNQDFCLNVPIRTLDIDASRHCSLGAGGGIVADSDPLDEYQESLAKARFARDMANEFQLIETLRWEADGSLPHLPYHLARLARSAEALDFACPRPQIEQALLAHCRATPHQGTWRLRLLLARDGHCTISSAPLPDLAGPLTATLASTVLDSADPRLRHKTTARSFYDAALAEATSAGHFDILFINERGELCEGARSNVFIERSGKLYTPALRSGLLPGVMRQMLIDQGRAEEATLMYNDLLGATHLWLGNALRGLIRVRLCADAATIVGS